MSEYYDGRLVVDAELGWLMLAASLPLNPVIANTDGTLYDEISDDGERTQAQEGHARRLVACWNTLRGLSTADLERIAADGNEESRFGALSALAGLASGMNTR